MQAAKPLFDYPKYWAECFGPAPFLPMSREEMDQLGWDSCDIIIVTGDAYVDHPSFGMAIIGRLLEAQGFRVGIRLTREIMNQPALDPYRGRELSPGVNVQSDAELDEFIRNHAETAFHPSCSCKMGSDDMAVVDGQGRVHGMEGLRVVDASIMPLIITGNLNATTIMMAEKIADRIRGRQPLPRSTAKYYVAGDAPVRGNPVRA